MDADGNSYGYTVITDYFIRDINDSDSDKVQRFTGWLVKRSGNWSSGWYRVTYTAGFDDDTTGKKIPQGLREALLELVIYKYNTRKLSGVKNVKVGDISYTYQDEQTYNGIPLSICNMLDRYRPVTL